ncbi:hypothetical protein LR48_Vigan07g208100 [Vigna angularis]|uniref:Uncharacterized protein n=2 Tax=Phaseolus angularis TaxID=3914 RepID=A0A0L9V0H5_PHAAN|nr:hypothetical protein LR48_Vigan07g208100 [Vigna angularis]BAT81947.1 hypothetical protein VIGAN_03186700 [Vigna angularis var. angularis]
MLPNSLKGGAHTLCSFLCASWTLKLLILFAAWMNAFPFFLPACVLFLFGPCFFKVLHREHHSSFFAHGCSSFAPLIIMLHLHSISAGPCEYLNLDVAAGCLSNNTVTAPSGVGLSCCTFSCWNFKIIASSRGL